ncbi:hypothetical protein PUN28_010176 [Cardiocondyla obscurior]|uniref:Uncharacterized protein n=1 Tax=Cardiocondyla obscurior TaxID=286306 RepID=A0AAW2FTD7_9HYME
MRFTSFETTGNVAFPLNAFITFDRSRQSVRRDLTINDFFFFFVYWRVSMFRSSRLLLPSTNVARRHDDFSSVILMSSDAILSRRLDARDEKAAEDSLSCLLVWRAAPDRLL